LLTDARLYDMPMVLSEV
jgi:hypothetical protein